MQTWLFVAAGGAIGACLRFGIAELMALLLGRHFPYGTLVVNVVGSFIKGVAYALTSHGHIVEQGTHEELLSANGFYADLYNSQFESAS